jgi:hypothetical protein
MDMQAKIYLHSHGTSLTPVVELDEKVPECRYEQHLLWRIAHLRCPQVRALYIA